MRTTVLMPLALTLALTSACAAPHDAEEIDRLGCFTCHAGSNPHETEDPPRSHECYRCHGTTNWGDAVIDHDSHFRISRGAHAGWDCGDCHQRGVSRRGDAGITCTNCHAHTSERTSLIHVGMGEYSYGPNTCINCHGDDD